MDIVVLFFFHVLDSKNFGGRFFLTSVDCLLAALGPFAARALLVGVPDARWRVFVVVHPGTGWFGPLWQTGEFSRAELTSFVPFFSLICNSPFGTYPYLCRCTIDEITVYFGRGRGGGYDSGR